MTSSFLVPSVLKTLNDLDIDSILIYSSFTSWLSISVWVYPELTSVLSYSFFLFYIFIFLCILSSLSLLSLPYGITYWFFKELLYTKIFCTIPTLNSNKILFFIVIFIVWIILYTPVLHLLFRPIVFWNMSYFVIFIILSSLFLYSASYSLLPYVYICCNWSIKAFLLCYSCF